MTGPNTVQRLEIWQDRMKTVEGVYQASGDWPIDERFGLVSQVRRAAVSIPANIAEGIGRETPREIARSCRIPLGSAYEVHTLVSLFCRFRFCSESQVAGVFEDLNVLTHHISQFIKYQESKG